MAYKEGEMTCAEMTYQVAQAVRPGKIEPRPFGGKATISDVAKALIAALPK